MKNRITSPAVLSLLILFVTLPLVAQKPVYQDTPFLQDFSVKYYAEKTGADLLHVAADRNGAIKVLSSEALFHPYAGAFLYPGSIVPDQTYRFQKDKKLVSVLNYHNQLVYLSDRYVFSNAWAGKILSAHQLPDAKLFAGGKSFNFMVSDGKALHLVQDNQILWKGRLDKVKEIRYLEKTDAFYILEENALHVFSVANKTLKRLLDGGNFNAFDLADNKAYIGTSKGFLIFDIAKATQIGAIQTKVPVSNITAVQNIHGRIWFGSSEGAYALRNDGKYDYYNGERWLPGNRVTDLAEGPDKSVLILTDRGLAQLNFKRMTLYDKAMFFDKQVRERHIRVGFNSSLSGMKDGNLGTGYLSDSDNDGLWTSMYLGGEVFRYAATKSKAALQNCRESLDAMERLYNINPVPGFPARSFERSGHISELSDPERWQHSPEADWDWKSTTSSDEVIGHIFVFAAIAELVDDADLKRRSITLIDTLMNHIVENDLYLIDFDGKPTQWGKWNPEYVNHFPIIVGDRKLNSSNIVSMLQTAYHFTKKEKYKKKAFELLNKHGYFENLMRPIKIIGSAPEGTGDLSELLSDGWNHSDDEMYFLGYWGLYRYALNDTLKRHYKKAIIDHWQAERPEREGLWNLMTAVTGTPDFDLKETIWYLKEHPLDLVDWNISNSHREDIEKLAPNFRKQTTKEVLPPDERPIQRHNANMFNLDRLHGNGTGEKSAGDIWLLPYWLGRYLGVISPPK